MTADVVQVGMVRTVAQRLEAIPGPVLLVLDEAHHAVAGTWVKIAATWPNAKILGVTATPERLDGRGLGEAFEEMVIGPDVRELIDAGHLAAFSPVGARHQDRFVAGPGLRDLLEETICCVTASLRQNWPDLEQLVAPHAGPEAGNDQHHH
jgi:Type III restriction enzyme, res subunit